MRARKLRGKATGCGNMEREAIRGRISIQDYNYVCLLEQIGKEDLARAGGKGANLGEMLRAGLPVPGGFVLLADAYRKFVEENDLQEEIDRVFTGVELEYDNPETIKEKTAQIEKLFEDGAIPAEVKQEIDQIYEYIEAPQVAVRSSATAEDLPGASFAGQYSTFLNIEGKEDLYEAIKKCWGSLWNERAVSYRAKQNIDHANLAHGVVVQMLYAKLFPHRAAPKVAGDAYRKLAAFKERRNNLQTLDQKLDFVEHETLRAFAVFNLSPLSTDVSCAGQFN